MKETAMRATRTVVTSVVAFSLALGAFPLGVQAGPVSPGATQALDKPTLVEQVHRRGWWRHRHFHGHHHHGHGAAALVGGIVAGALIAGAIREGRARDYDMDRCADEFRSFDPRRGTIINRYGDEVVCPYLR
jgi:hypothetical protein